MGKRISCSVKINVEPFNTNMNYVCFLFQENLHHAPAMFYGLVDNIQINSSSHSRSFLTTLNVHHDQDEHSKRTYIPKEVEECSETNGQNIQNGIITDSLCLRSDVYGLDHQALMNQVETRVRKAKNRSFDMPELQMKEFTNKFKSTLKKNINTKNMHKLLDKENRRRNKSFLDEAYYDVMQESQDSQSDNVENFEFHEQEKLE